MMKPSRATTNRTKTSSLRYVAVFLFCSIAVFGVGYWWLKPTYGEISKLGYEYAMALASACNRQDQARLNVITESVNRELAESKLSPSDAEVLLRIARFAQEGNWKKATVESRELLDAQVGSKLAVQN